MKTAHPLRPAAGPLCLVVALGTRGDVQPLACLALQLQRQPLTSNDLCSCCPKDHNQLDVRGFRVCFITHAAHSSWLSSPPYESLFHVQLIPSAPAGKWWEEHSPTQPCRSPSHNPTHLPATVCARGPSHDSCSSPPPSHHPVTRPDSAVVEAVLRCLTTYPHDAANQPSDTPSCPGPCRAAGLAAAAFGSPALGPPGPASHPPAPPCPAQLQGHSQLPSDATPSLLPEAAAPTTSDIPDAALSTGAAACAAAAGRSPPHVDTQKPPRQAGEQPLRAMVLFNLFALEAYHVAEALQLPCAVAAPYAMPYRCPSAFTRAFASELPELYAALVGARQQQRQEQVAASCTTNSTGRGGCSTGGASAGGSSAPWPRVTFAEVQHWMWPLFTERWGEWRQRQLGLPQLPLHHPTSHRPLCGPGELPPAPPLLYGFSELVVPRPSFWPPSIHVCGFWQPPQSWFTGQSLPAELEAVLCLAQLEGGHHAIGGCKAGNSTSTLASSSAVATPPSGGTSGGWRGVVCVDFGSMGRMGLLPAGGLRRLLGVLCGALGELGMLGVFLTAGWEPLHAAAAELQAASEGCGTGSQAPQGQQQVGTKAEEQPLGQSCEYGEAAEEPHQKRPRHDGASGSHECVALCVDPSVGDTRDLDVHAEAGCAREDRWCRAYGGWLYLYPRAVPHQLLLPRCALLLHHGGSGTTAAALQCGTPQLLCPLQFDQHYWAERLAYMALSPPPLEREQLVGSTAVPELPANTTNNPWADAVTALVAAMRDAVSDERRRAVADLVKELRQEDGLEAAARVVRGAFMAHVTHADAHVHRTDM